MVITAVSLGGTGVFTEDKATGANYKFAFTDHVAREGTLEYTSRTDADLFMDTTIKVWSQSYSIFPEARKTLLQNNSQNDLRLFNSTLQ